MAQHEPLLVFVKLVAEVKSKYIGRDIAGNPTSYVPLGILREYWTARRVSRVLHSFPVPLDLDVHLIRTRYLQIFSMLVYSDYDAVRNLQPLFISRNLTDDSLPWSSRPSAWPDEKFFRDFFRLIAANQWQFFPLRFSPDRLQDFPAG